MFGSGKGWSALGPLSSKIKSRSERPSKFLQGLPTYQSSKDQDEPKAEPIPPPLPTAAEEGIPRRDYNRVEPPVSMGLLKAFSVTKYGMVPFAPGAYQSGNTYGSLQQSGLPPTIMGNTSQLNLGQLRQQLQMNVQRVPEDMYGRKDWEQHFKSWKDIGQQYMKHANKSSWVHVRSAQPIEAVPKEETEFCLKQGITFERKLGEGGYGAVWLASKGNQKYACKILELFTYAPKLARASKLPWKTVVESVKQLLNEAEIHKILNHRNIIRCEHIVHLHDQITGFPHCRLLIFMELCEGDLNKLIKNSIRKKPFTESEAKEMFIEVCSGLKYLHEQNICHLDIKPHNIMFVTEGAKRVYKLADFGLTKKFDSDVTMMNVVAGTWLYMAPEMVDGSASFDAKLTDIYSLGCVLTESLVGNSWMSFLKFVRQGQSLPYIFSSNNISQECGELIARMTSVKPGPRPKSIDEIFESSWLKKP